MNLLSTKAGRRLLFGALYFAEGAPIGYCWWALPTRLRAAGVPLPEITGLTSALVIPWTLKFLAAPIVDATASAKGRLRAWILTAQALMAATLLPAGWLDPTSQLGALTVFLLLHATCAALQDVAVDALCIEAAPTEELGRLNAWMQGGMLVGRAAFGGATLVLASWLGDRGTILVLAGVLVAVMALVGIGVPADAGRRASGRAPITAGLGDVLRARTTWLGLAFALVGAAGFEAVGAVVGPFLIDHGATQEDAGRFYAGPVVVCMAAGSFAGGWLADRTGRVRAVAFVMAAGAGTIASLALADGLAEAPAVALLTLLGGIAFAHGAFTSSSYALLMDLTDRRVAATQFSAFMGATNACEAWSTNAIGRIAGSGGWSAGTLTGYPIGFLALAAVTLLASALLPGLRSRDAASRASTDRE